MSCTNCLHRPVCLVYIKRIEQSRSLDDFCIDCLNKDNFVEVKHAYWVLNKHQAEDEKSYFCSLCAEGGSDFGFDAYCNACGAKMDLAK